MLKKCFLWLTAILISFAAVSADAEVDKTDPYKMMQQVSENTFNRLKAEQDKINADPNYLKVVVNDELMPYVNERYAALKLLGPNLKGAKREDVLTFVKAFHGYLVTSYAQVLTQYDGQEIRFGNRPSIDDKATITGVQVSIIDSPRPNIKLEFKLRKDKKSGEWKAFDMIAEGVSLLSSKQSEWNSKIRQEGILSVAAELQKLADAPIRFEGSK